MLGVIEAHFTVELLGPLCRFVIIIIFQPEVVFLCLLPFLSFSFFVSFLFGFYFILCFCIVNGKGGDKLTLPVSESDRSPAAASSPVPAVVDVAIPAASSAGGATAEECPSSPVTMTYFQQLENGDLEKKTVPESNNPFSNCGSAASYVAPPADALPSKNPFLTDEVQSSNPFLSRLVSPVLTRSASPMLVSDVPPLSVDVTVASESVSTSQPFRRVTSFFE